MRLLCISPYPVVAVLTPLGLAKVQGGVGLHSLLFSMSVAGFDSLVLASLGQYRNLSFNFFHLFTQRTQPRQTTSNHTRIYTIYSRRKLPKNKQYLIISFMNCCLGLTFVKDLWLHTNLATFSLKKHG